MSSSHSHITAVEREDHSCIWACSWSRISDASYGGQFTRSLRICQRCSPHVTRIVFLCDGWLRHAILISCIRIIRLHGFFFISWASSHVKDDCYVGCTHRSLQDKFKSTVHSMFTVPNVFGLWQCEDTVSALLMLAQSDSSSMAKLAALRD